ncbi:MAG: type II and III secretion system protein [Treponema sp.]|nr:type II and III secretion system protein [Treponema sp.]
MKKIEVYKNVFVGFLFLFMVAARSTLYADEKFSWEFPDSDIKDVLFALSVDAGISIVPDDTVFGKVDFRFSGSDFETAFGAFLENAGLYVSKEKDLWTVSRIRIFEEDGYIKADCSGLKPVAVMEKLSRNLSVNITYEQLPSPDLSFHVKGKTEKELMENLVGFLTGYVLEPKENGFHIGRKLGKTETSSDGYSRIVLNEDGSVTVDVKNGMFSTAVESLLKQVGKSFCFPGNNDIKISRAVFASENADKVLELLCRQNGFSCFEKDGVLYFFSGNKNLNGYGLVERNWTYFKTSYTDSQTVLPFIQKRFPGIEVSEGAGDKGGFWIKTDSAEKAEIEKILSEIDRSKETYLIPLKYIKAEEFIKRLPPGIERNSVSEADGNCCLYFTGTKEAYESVLKEIELSDRPKKRIKYDLLILQYDDTSDNQWVSNFKARDMKIGDRNSLNGQLGSVLGFNLNVVSAFGLDFALSLQNSISENRTRVFADTSLHGVAGKEINFSNTNTYRYRDNNLDPETGKPVYSGVTREIVSGLKMDINSWIGEDGLITTNVKASVTRRGTDTSSVTGNPPPTSEKLVTTEVCCRSGEPVVLSGLVQDSENEEKSRTPVFSKIPLLGKFFRSESKNQEHTQMVIYLVPFIEDVEKQETQEKYNEEWLNKRKEELCGILNSN